MSDWQPIETAPKDGTVVIISTGSHSLPAYWGRAGSVAPAGSDKRFPWVVLDPTNGINQVSTERVTHWLPLPPPPKTEPEA